MIQRSFYAHLSYVYTVDVGNGWRVKTAWRFGDNPKLGFEPSDVNDLSVRRAPAGKALQLCYVTVVNAQTGVRRKVPVGKLSAPIFRRAAAHSFEQLYHPSTGVPETSVVSSYVGEQRR